jgi:alkylresorcinol/alkylpyrone synthase
VTRPPRLLAVASATPPHVTRQEDARSLAALLFSEALGEDGRLIQVFDHAEIRKRHMCVPLEWFATDHSFAEKNALYVEHAVRLAREVAEKAMARAGLGSGEIDHVVFVSSTGLATPSVDALLANELDFRSDFRRTPIWGLGCAGGASGLARARDFALADPSARILLISLELCSLTFQHGDLSKRSLVAASLFADGAAAAVVVGGGVEGPRRNGRRPLELVASRSVLWRDTLDVMGWTIDGDGLHVVFSRDIPTIVRENVRPSLDAFLEAQGLQLGTLDHFVAHPGGVKVLHAYGEALGLPAEALHHAREILCEYGNMSSPTCLFVLERFLAADEIGAGQSAVVAALGPGFSAEYVLLRGAA